MWTQGVIELYRWRQERKAQAARAAQLVEETEAYLRGVRYAPPLDPSPLDPSPLDRPRWTEPPRTI